jgi:hypothetical protein
LLRPLRVLWFRVTSLVRRSQLDSDLAEEMNLHRDLLAEDARRSGVPDAEARRLAAVRLGNASVIRERSREWRSLPVFETAARDIRYAARFSGARPSSRQWPCSRLHSASAPTRQSRSSIACSAPAAGNHRRRRDQAAVPARRSAGRRRTSAVASIGRNTPPSTLFLFQSVAGFLYPSPVKLRTGCRRQRPPDPWSLRGTLTSLAYAPRSAGFSPRTITRTGRRRRSCCRTPTGVASSDRIPEYLGAS